MKKADLGTGYVGDTISSKLVEAGHSVWLGSRIADNDKAKAFVVKNNGASSARTFANAATFGEIIFNCWK